MLNNCIEKESRFVNPEVATEIFKCISINKCARSKDIATKVATNLSYSPSTVYMALDKMAKMGIVRKVQYTNRKYTVYELTKEGQTLAIRFIDGNTSHWEKKELLRRAVMKISDEIKNNNRLVENILKEIACKIPKLANNPKELDELKKNLSKILKESINVKEGII